MTRIVLFGFGSRGDVQPLIALGMGLQAAGYETALAAGINFEPLVREHGLGFEPIQVDVEAFMNTEVGKTWLNESSHNPMQELRNMQRMTEAIAEQVTDDIMQLVQRADVLVSGVLTVEAMETVAHAYHKRHIVGLLAPFTPTSSGAAGLQALLPRSETMLNRWWGYWIQSMLYRVLRGPSMGVRRRLNLPAVSAGDFMRAWNRTPTLLGVSPLVTPPPSDWPAHIHTTGYWFLDAPANWQPSPALHDFLEAGPPPVYVGFGSMSNRNPQATTRLIVEALQAAGQRGIIYGGWAGLHAEDLPPEIFLLDGAPHDWLFPRMAAVVHHGGAGTSAAGLRAGVPSTIVAHIGDQWYWGRRVHELGAGAPPLRRHQLTSERLAQVIRSMTQDRAMQARAAELGARIRAEDGVARAVEYVQQILAQ